LQAMLAALQSTSSFLHDAYVLLHDPLYLPL
jgi:hypothetical protein